jgi:hypothetical protein
MNTLCCIGMVGRPDPLHHNIQDVVVTMITEDIDRGDWIYGLAEAVVDPFVPVAHSNRSTDISH